MNFRSTLERGRSFFERHQINILIGGVFLIGIFLGWGIGIILSQTKHNPIIIDRNVKMVKPADLLQILESGTNINTKGNFVASVNGKNYYPGDCAAANRIKEENRIWFNTAKEAEAQGYTQSKSCEF